MIGVTCSNCGTEILVPPTVQGKPGICFGCGAALRVPDYSNIPRLRELVFSAGDRIANRYSIEERIGQGGMGVVYRAKDTLVDEEVALKFLKPQLLRTQQGLATFIQEAQIARRLRHDNIVAVHDISWTSEGILFLSMEFLRGQSLRALLRRHRSERRLLDVRFAVHVSACILDALAHAHRTVVHRDLKPENIMILPGEHVKVLDFGLAMAIEEESARNARNGTAAGTFAYAAPEQKRGQAVDLRADLYTVGLIFYELLTLRTPIDEQIPIPNIRRDVSPSLMDILARALTLDRAERWPSASAFRRALLQAFEQSYRAAATTPSAYTPSGKASTEGMVYLEGGSFLMGNDLIVEEAPQFEAHVEPFYMDIYPVTVKQYRAFLEATGRPAPRSLEDPNYSGPNQPVVGVTGTTPMPMRHGPASACRPRRNGNSRRAARKTGPIHGDIWSRTPTTAIFATTSVCRPSSRCTPKAGRRMAFMIWGGTYTNGPSTPLCPTRRPSRGGWRNPGLPCVRCAADAGTVPRRTSAARTARDSSPNRA